MLLRFRAKNHLSLRDAEEISLVASTAIDDDPDGLIACPAIHGHVLPVSVIYGANASGKSNFIQALRFMCSAVLFSHSKWDPGGIVPRHTFALDPELRSTPSQFEIDFVVEGVRHHYGFIATDDTFTAEWLFAFPKGRRQILFDRNEQKFDFGRNLKGKNKSIEEVTRPNSLFISAAAQNNHQTILPIISFFRSIYGVTTVSASPAHVSNALQNAEMDQRVIHFLSQMDTGVTCHTKIDIDIPDEMRNFENEVTLAAKKAGVDIQIGKHKHIIKLGHNTRDGSTAFFNLDQESEGTRRLLILMTSVFNSLDNGSPLVIDELNASLHTLACESILGLFNSSSTNPRGAQLIATTHDTNLLRSAHLRRDQVWFAEKDHDGATHIYPLTDMRTRKGDNLEKGYLQGRFGAVPFSGPMP
ncbi:AAA family ATPase [Magnetospirillum fulvum]|uniref:ATPase AAA-type core domain-containing protein n=1 Tax=Magnetospirillum fulvum TaxID=1082 RepID=A0A1H6H071_MAGFU|nr:ATP-binding protein [Magnetospirillum fulvum]SEH28572.1 hypothetical protein SAMN04244559_00726 [Magnetospirillum fulvum]